MIVYHLSQNENSEIIVMDPGMRNRRPWPVATAAMATTTTGMNLMIMMMMPMDR